MSKKVKIFAIVVLVIAVIIAISSFASRNKSANVSNRSSNPLSSTTGVVPLPDASPNTKASDDEFSKVLSTIKSISIDTSIFQNRAYTLLRDFPVSVGSDVVGRNNPFAPIGVDSPLTDIGDVSVQTLQAGKITKTTAEAGAQVAITGDSPVSIVFEYGTSDTFGAVTPPVTVTKNTTVLATLNNLLPDTLYYVRAVAVVNSNTTTANITSFVTTK